MLADLLAQRVPFAITAGIRVLEAGPAGGRAQIANWDSVQDHLGALQAAATFGVAEAASAAAIIGALADRLRPGGDQPSVRTVVSDADITFWRLPKHSVLATATIDTPAGAEPTADGLIRRRTVSVTVALADDHGQAIGRAAFHWVITPRPTGGGPAPSVDPSTGTSTHSTDTGAQP